MRRCLTTKLLLCRAQTNFNALELMRSMPDDTRLTLDAMRKAAPQHMGGNLQRRETIP